MADFDWTSLIAPAIGAGVAAYSASQNKKAADRALEAQQSAGAQIGASYAPYTGVGADAAARLGDEDITKLPGYQSGLDAGQSAINRAAAARGQFFSGNALKAATKYGIDYNAGKTAERENQLMRLLGVGQGATNANAGYTAGLGNAAAASGISKANSSNSGLAGALGTLGSYLTSKNDNGRSNASNIYDSLKSVWAPSSSPSSFGSYGGGSGSGWGLDDSGGFWGS